MRLREAILGVRDAVVGGDRNFIAMEYAAGALLARHGWHVDYVVVRNQRAVCVPNPMTRRWSCWAPPSSARQG